MNKSTSITLIDCLRMINQLEKMKDLIRHQNRWTRQIDLARPLNKLGISEKDPHRYELIRQKINKLLPLATRAAEQMGVSTKIKSREEKPGTFPTEYEDKIYDLFIHYDLLMLKDHTSSSAHHFDMTIDKLNQLIGLYSEAIYRRLISFLNPLRLVASILRIPITVLEYMGFDTRGSLAETVFSVIIRALWILFLAVLTVYFSGKSAIIKEFLKLINH